MTKYLVLKAAFGTSTGFASLIHVEEKVHFSPSRLLRTQKPKATLSALKKKKKKIRQACFPLQFREFWILSISPLGYKRFYGIGAPDYNLLT